MNLIETNIITDFVYRHVKRCERDDQGRIQDLECSGLNTGCDPSDRIIQEIDYTILFTYDMQFIGVYLSVLILRYYIYDN